MNEGLLAILIIVIIVAAFVIWALYISGKKHFCRGCEIAYVYSPSALKRTHCGNCGKPLTSMTNEYDSEGNKRDEDER